MQMNDFPFGTSELHSQAWRQWFSFLKNNSGILSSGHKSIEQQVYDLFPTLGSEELLVCVLYNARKKKIKFNGVCRGVKNNPRQGHINFLVEEFENPVGIKRRVELLKLTIPFSTLRSDWPRMCFVPKQWLELSLDELSQILQRIEAIVNNATGLDDQVNWTHIRPRASSKIRRVQVQKSLRKRFNVAGQAKTMKTTFAEICAYTMLRQMERKTGRLPTSEEIIQQFLDCAENDMLLLVE